MSVKKKRQNEGDKAPAGNAHGVCVEISKEATESVDSGILGVRQQTTCFHLGAL